MPGSPLSAFCCPFTGGTAPEATAWNRRGGSSRLCHPSFLAETRATLPNEKPPPQGGGLAPFLVLIILLSSGALGVLGSWQDWRVFGRFSAFFD